MLIDHTNYSSLWLSDSKCFFYIFDFINNELLDKLYEIMNEKIIFIYRTLSYLQKLVYKNANTSYCP